MHALEHQMSRRLLNRQRPLLRRRAPAQKHDAALAHAHDGVDDALGEALPAFVRVAVGLVRLHRQTRVEQQDAAVGPGRQQAAVVRGRLEIWVVLFQTDVDVAQRGGQFGARPDGEAEPVGLVVVVVGVLAQDDDFDGVERCVAGPG
jgi:hypothetical protein